MALNLAPFGRCANKPRRPVDSNVMHHYQIGVFYECKVFWAVSLWGNQLFSSVDIEPVFTGNCHCKDCQRSSGSAFMPAMIFPEKDVVVSGEVKYFELQADSGNMHKRGFCPNCGSQLFARFSHMPEMLGIKAGTLNDLSNYVPKLDFHVSSAAPWNFMNPELPKKQGAAQS